VAARAARLAARASLRAAAAAPAATAALVDAERPAACLPLTSTSFLSLPSAPAGLAATGSFSGGAATPSAAGAAPAVETVSGMRRKMYARKLRPLPAHAAGGVQHGTFGSWKPSLPVLLHCHQRSSSYVQNQQEGTLQCRTAAQRHACVIPSSKPSLNHSKFTQWQSPDHVDLT